MRQRPRALRTNGKGGAELEDERIGTAQRDEDVESEDEYRFEEADYRTGDAAAGLRFGLFLSWGSLLLVRYFFVGHISSLVKFRILDVTSMPTPKGAS